MPVADVISAIELIGLAATTPKEEDEPARVVGGYLNGDTRQRQGIEVALRCVEAAMPIIQGWPEAYYDLLATIAGRNPHPPRAYDPFATRIGRMVRRPNRGLDGRPIACLTDAVTEFLKLKLGLRPRKRSFTMESRTARLVARRASRAATARRFGVDDAEPVFQRIYEAALRAFDSADTPPISDLTDRFLAEVERRWFEAKSMMSATDASLVLDHPKHSHEMGPWIHPDLLTPVAQATEIHLCRRKPSFRFEDVYAMRRRLADQAIAFETNQVPAGYVLYSKITSRICCGGYSKQALLLDIVSGKISTARTVPEPRLCDLYLNSEQARDCSIAVRFRKMIEKDPFCRPNVILRLLAEFWPGQPNFESGIDWRDLRRAEALRYREFRNTDGGRDRPGYYYSLVDCLERQHLLSGASISPSTDAVIAAHRRTRRPDERPRLIADQTLSSGLQPQRRSRSTETQMSKRSSLAGPRAGKETEKCGIVAEALRVR
jgi:hypothetical protein